jgi:hypothetical protein
MQLVMLPHGTDNRYIGDRNHYSDTGEKKLGKRMNAWALFNNYNTYQMLLCQRYCIYNTKN